MLGGGIVGVPPHRDLIYLTTGFRVPRGMQNNSDSRLLQQFFIRKIISVKVGSPRDIEIVQISGKITPVGFNLSCASQIHIMDSQQVDNRFLPTYSGPEAKKQAEVWSSGLSC